MPIVPQDQLSGPQWSSIALIGRPFSGKTESLATLHTYLVKHKMPTKMVYFDYDEHGNNPLIRTALAQNYIQDLEIHRFNVFGSTTVRLGTSETRERTSDPMEKMIQELNNLFDRMDTRSGYWQPGQEIGAVIHDSMTALNDRWFDFVLKKRHKEVGGTAQLNNNVSFNEWTMVKEKMVETIRATRSLPCFSVFCFHEILIQEEISGPKPEDVKTTGQMLWVPKITGDLTTTVQKEFTIVVHTRAVNGKYEWIVKPDDQIRSVGTRSKRMIDARVEQDFANILAD